MAGSQTLVPSPALIALLATRIAAGAVAGLLFPLLAGVGAIAVWADVSAAAVASPVGTFLFSHIDLLSLTGSAWGAGCHYWLARVAAALTAAR